MVKKNQLTGPSKAPVRRGLTLLQKYELCCLRAKHPSIKLLTFSQLEECPKRPDGRPLATSSLSEHLKGWQQRVDEGPPESM